MKSSKLRFILLIGMIFIICLNEVVYSMAATVQTDLTTAETEDTDASETEENKDSGSEGESEAYSTGRLYIDSQNIYEGMTKSYSEGYVPAVENGKAVIVIPLQCSSSLKDNQIRTSLNLGEGDSIPFVHKNYQNSFVFGTHKVNDGSGSASCWLVSFSLDLKSDRINGSYPVVLNVTAEDENGNEMNQEFTTYVTITDGKDPHEEITTEEVTEEAPQFVPKVLVSSYGFSKDNIQAGDVVTAEIILVNTSSTDKIRNMTVTVVPDENIGLLSESDSIYIESVGKNETFSVSYAFQVDMTAPQGQYSIAVNMDYADSDGNTYTSTGTIKLTVAQLVKMQFDKVSIPTEIEVGETVSIQTQVMNLGRGTIYNVRAEIEAEGLTAKGTMFIGDIEAGSAVTGSAEVTAVGLSGNSMYGETSGIITFYYEDEAGNEYSEEAVFSTCIISPMNQKRNAEPEDEVSQWWIIMCVIAVILMGIAAFIVLRKMKLGKNED